MRLLLVEDDQKLAEFIGKGFIEAGFEVSHAGHGHAGLDAASRELFDCLVMDLMLPGMDGLTLIKSIRAAGIQTPIIMISAKQSVDSRVDALRLGADDFLVKPFSFTELLARTHAAIRRGEGYREPSQLKVADLSVDLMARSVVRAGESIVLQNREFELLAYLMRNAGRVVSKTMIIENVWNFNFDPHTNIVEARMSKLREKIDKPFSHRLIHTVRGVGYSLRPPHV